MGETVSRSYGQVLDHQQATHMTTERTNASFLKRGKGSNHSILLRQTWAAIIIIIIFSIIISVIYCLTDLKSQWLWLVSSHFLSVGLIHTPRSWQRNVLRSRLTSCYSRISLENAAFLIIPSKSSGLSLASLNHLHIYY